MHQAAQRQIGRRLQVAYFACVAVIVTWLSSNQLKLNANKTEFIWLGTRQQLAKLNSEPLQLKGELIMPLEKFETLALFRRQTEHGRSCPERRPQLLLPASEAAYHSELTANGRPMHRSRRVHCQSSRLL